MVTKYKKLKYVYATEAHHKLGDISRYVDGKFTWDDLIERGVKELTEHVAQIDSEDEENYIGAWVTGIGFFDVKFPKKTTRALTESEIEELSNKRFRINSQPSWSLGDIETI